MKKLLTTAVLVLSSVSLAASGTSMMGTSMKGTSMMGSSMMGSSMMGNSMMGMSMMKMYIKAYPGAKRTSHHVTMAMSTSTYASSNGKAIFDYYSAALMKAGWKEDMGMKMGMTMKGTYQEAYIMGKDKLDLTVKVSGMDSMVTLNSHM